MSRLLGLLMVSLLGISGTSSAPVPEGLSAANGVATDPVKPVRWLDDLGLDDKQKEKLREIWKSKRGTVQGLRDQISSERSRLKQLMSSDAGDSEVTASYRKIRSTQAQLNEIDLQSMLAVREMLTLKQRETFVEHMSLRGRLGEESPGRK